MKKVILKFSILLLSSMLIFTACSKKKDPVPTDDTSVQTQNGSDDSDASSESDAALNDANTAIAGQLKMNGARMAATIPLTGAGATYVYDSTAIGKRIVITYDGSTQINGRTRKGKVTAIITGNRRWTSPGTVLALTFDSLKATNVLTQKSIMLNGTKTVTNVHGGNIKTLASTDSLVHKIRSNTMTLTFDDGTIRTWNVARTRTIKEPTSGNFVISVTGDTNVGGYTNVAMWGANRAGKTFYSSISTPIVWNNTACTTPVPYYVPVSGVRVIQGLDHTLTITFGVTSTGAAATGCPDGFKLDWVNAKGESKEVIRLY